VQANLYDLALPLRSLDRGPRSKLSPELVYMLACWKRGIVLPQRFVLVSRGLWQAKLGLSSDSRSGPPFQACMLAGWLGKAGRAALRL
jgi:hypothetical protein